MSLPRLEISGATGAERVTVSWCPDTDIMAFLALREEYEGESGVLRQVITKGHSAKTDMDRRRFEPKPRSRSVPAGHSGKPPGWGKWFKEMVDQFVPDREEDPSQRGLYLCHRLFTAESAYQTERCSLTIPKTTNFIKDASEPAQMVRLCPVRANQSTNGMTRPRYSHPKSLIRNSILWSFAVGTALSKYPDLSTSQCHTFAGGAPEGRISHFAFASLVRNRAWEDVLLPIAKMVGQAS